MISVFLREQKRYSQKELLEIFDCSEEQLDLIISKLKEFGILKIVRKSSPQLNISDLIDEYVEIIPVEAIGKDYYYVFLFVGILIVASRIIKCYPKYLCNVDNPIKELQVVCKVIEKYSSKEQIIYMLNDYTGNSSFNLLAVLLFLMHDYFENGIYNNSKNIFEINGSGEVFWDKTINETFSILSNNRPYYIEIQTKKRVNNDFDYFKRLHECILTLISKELMEADLLSLFELTPIELIDECLTEFGDREYILYRLENELNIQFNTRKQLVLKGIYSYIKHGGQLDYRDGFAFFGTNSFNLVWECVCSEILNNQLNMTLGQLRLPITLNKEYNLQTKLINLIEKPFWSIIDKEAKDTLTPDLITICNNQFYIFDAKYYTPNFKPGELPKGQPGIESISKQYLYQLAYKKFIDAHGFEGVKNCFLLPTEEDTIIDLGEVSMKMFSNLGLENIKVRCIPANIAYDYYLLGKKLDINMLKLNN